MNLRLGLVHIVRASHNLTLPFCSDVAPMGSPSRGGGVSQLSLPTPFPPSLSVLLPTRICQLSFFSPINFSPHICSSLAWTVLSVFTSHSPIFLFFQVSLCNFSFSLWSAAHHSCGSVNENCPKGGSGG